MATQTAELQAQITEALEQYDAWVSSRAVLVDAEDSPRTLSPTADEWEYSDDDGIALLHEIVNLIKHSVSV